MWDLLMGGNTSTVQQRSHSITVNGETTPCYDYVYDVLKDGTARLDLTYSCDEIYSIPEFVDGYPVSTLGRNLFSEITAYVSKITIPDCVTTLEGNPFDLNVGYEIIVSDTHPTLEVVDGVLFSKPDHRLVCAFFTMECDPNNPLDGYYVPEGTLTIEDHAFARAVLQGTVFIPNSVTTLGKNPFYFRMFRVYKISIPENHPTLEIVDNILYSKPDRRLVCYTD